MRRSTAIAMGLLLCWMGTRTAQAGVGVSGKIGTLGWGGDVTLGLGREVNLRLGFSQFSYDIESDVDAEEISDVGVEIDFQTMAGLLDWHPGAHSFRITGGVMINGNEIRLWATPGDQLEINDEQYVVSDLSGEVTFRDLAPYFGIGVGNAADRTSHFHFSFDLGIMFQGEPEVSISATAADPALQAQLDAAIAAEIDDIEEDTDSFTFYPVIAFGISYTF